jgi:hypothetical protein
MAKQKATQAYIAEFKNAREEWKVRERQRMEEENIKIRDFARIQQLRESERMQNKKAKEESMARVQQAVSYQLNERFQILTLSYKCHYGQFFWDIFCHAYKKYLTAFTKFNGLWSHVII